MRNIVRFNVLKFVGKVGLASVLLVGAIGVVCVSLVPPSARADGAGFSSVWKLLTREQKRQFVAGYLNGMRDAAKMTEVLQSFVHSNPDQAGSSLDRLSQLYLEVGRSDVDSISDGIDRFYSDPQNEGGQLSAAVTASKNPKR